MRIIKLALISFIILFGLVTFFSLFIPGNVRISKAMNIAEDDSTTFQQIDKLVKWIKWHPALKQVPDSEIVVQKDGSLKIQDTRISIIGSGDEEITTEIVQGERRPVISGFKIIRHPEGDSATLQWYMNFKLHWYPWEKFKSLFYENFYGVQMEQGLANLREQNH